MHHTSALRKPGIRELKQAFLAHLPDRVTTIAEHWRLLAQVNWDPDKLLVLLQQLRNLTGSSGKFGLIQVSESVLALEIYLSSFSDDETHPSPRQIDEVFKLIRVMESATKELVKTTSLDHGRAEPASDTKIVILRLSRSFAENLLMALESLHCSVESFGRVDDIIALFEMQVPDMVLIDTALLPMLNPFFELLNQRNHEQEGHLPLAFIANTNDLNTRLRALRMGADAYFVTPLDANAVAAKIKRIASPGKENSYRVLIVDDDSSQAVFAASILKQAGMKTRTVVEPLKVLQILDEFRPDLILMDLYMPEANGMELTAIIREQNEFVGIPIIFLSGEQETDKQLDALSVGGDDFIAKPIRPRHLIAIISNRIRRTREIQHGSNMHSSRDPVTGLFTRRYFFKRLEAMLSQDKVVAGGVLIIELDSLSNIRHKTDKSRIDALLTEAGTLIANRLEPQDVASSIGDCACGVIVGRPSTITLKALAEQLREAIAAHLFHPEQGSLTLTTTASIGICPFSEPLNDATGLVARATAASNKAHAGGGDRVEIYRTEVEQSGKEQEQDKHWRLHLVQQSLTQDGFQVLFQPFINLHQRSDENYAVMLRLRTPEGDLIPPSEFMPEARRGGLLTDIDAWITDHALMLMDEYRSQGRKLNLLIPQNPETLEDPDRINWLREQLRSRQLVGTGLTLEFNLVDLAGNLKAAKLFIDAMQNMGLAISLARFNADMAAFKVLHYLQVDYIKVADQFIDLDQETIRTLIDKAHAMGVKVIAPSVDDPQAIEPHWASGADFIQGNFIQRPAENPQYDFSGKMHQV